MHHGSTSDIAGPQCLPVYSGDGSTLYAAPNHGTAMGPPHSCDYVDVYMGQLDQKLVDTCPVPLLSSLLKPEQQEEYRYLDWSRYRDDGITVLLDPLHAKDFETHIQSLNPPNIQWTMSVGTTASYLDIGLSIVDGKIVTDVYSKSSHSYLPPTSCHSPAVFKGLISGVGTRLRMICSDDHILEQRIEEYSRYFALAGWDINTAKSKLKEGASKDREKLLKAPRVKKPKKLAWVTTFDPRLPSKSEIIRRNLPILHADPQNKELFPKSMIIAADRRRKNLSEIYKPTVPRRFVIHGPENSRGFFKCSATRCDT